MTAQAVIHVRQRKVSEIKLNDAVDGRLRGYDDNTLKLLKEFRQFEVYFVRHYLGPEIGRCQPPLERADGVGGNHAHDVVDRADEEIGLHGAERR